MHDIEIYTMYYTFIIVYSNCSTYFTIPHTTPNETPITPQLGPAVMLAVPVAATVAVAQRTSTSSNVAVVAVVVVHQEAEAVLCLDRQLSHEKT